MVKITIFNGSPRGPSSNTHKMVKEFTKGAIDGGAEVENIFLVERNIGHCLGCFGCWIKTPGKCVIDDDIRELNSMFIGSDIVVFATPVYVDGVTGLMKNFMDRMIPIVDPHFTKDEKGETRHVRRYEKYPKTVVISNCGFPGIEHFQVVSHHYHRMARNMHSEIIGEIYLPMGPILEFPNPIVEPMRMKYRKLLRKAGKEIVEKGSLSPELRGKLEAPIVPEKMYFDGANKGFDKRLKKLGS
jgi:multimeric flavodoxin WrbA